MNIQPVILSGGSGSRLWPASREALPKQLLPLTGDVSLLQITAGRLDGFPGNVADPLIVTAERYRFFVEEQLRQIHKDTGAIILEPMARNTAPAMQLAALAASREGHDPILLVMPADQIVTRPEVFRRAVERAALRAEEGEMVTFGIFPSRPETGFGYIRKGPPVDEGVHEVADFIEKPDVQRARAYLESGGFLWNSGIFMMKASVWKRALHILNPEMARICAQALDAGGVDARFIHVDRSLFETCPSDSIDYAVMEKLFAHPELGQPVVVPMDAGWSDVGAWDALWNVCDKDQEGNVARGEVMLDSTRDSVIFAQSRLVATIGLKDVIVVETPDAVMVADKASAQDVRKIVSRLEHEGRPQATDHRKVYRPWGWYDPIDSGERFQVKRIVVKPGASLSLQLHHHRAEHWVVVSGTAEVTIGDDVVLLSENQSTYIPLGVKHRLANPGKLPLEIIEIQSGSYLGEDDIIRFDDVYGR